MTWRVAILALTIMLAGATAPLIRNGIGGRDGYRVMGVAMALVILAGVVLAYRGTSGAPVGTAQTAIVLGFSLLPAVLTLLSLLWLRGYTLDAETVDHD